MSSIPRDIPVSTRSVYRPPPDSRFRDIEKIGPNSVGMVGVISQRLSTGMLTFAIFRVFERDGRQCQTGFVPEDMGEIYLDFTKIVLERMRALRASNDLPVPTVEPQVTT